MPKHLTGFVGPLRLLTVLTGTMLILSGCETMMGSDANNQAACIVWKPTPWHVEDTDETIRGNKRNNAARQAFCND